MSRTTDLMVNIYGNDKSASKTLKGVGKEADTASDKFKRMGKVAATSFVAVAGAAVAFATSAAKAAVEDQKSQKMLAASIKNTAKATDAQVKSTEDFITKMQLTYGIADDKLRPAFATLTRATGDLTESQNLMQVAMDVSAGTGKDLSAVSLALAKAHNGNIGALTRLGVPLDKAIIKNKDFKGALEVLTKTFNGSAKEGAKTFAGKMDIVKQKLGEAKEQIGYALMPILTTMATYLTDTIVPNVQAFVDGLTGVKDGSDGAHSSLKDLGEKTRDFFKFIGDHEEMLKRIGTIIGAIFIGTKASAAVSAMTSALALLVPSFGGVATAAGTAAAAEAAATGGASLAVAAPAIIGIATALGIGGLAAMYTWKGSKSGGKDTAKALSAIRAGKPIDFSGSVTTTKGAGAQGGSSADLFGPQRTKLYNGTTYIYDDVKKKYYVPNISGKRDYSVQPRAVGGSVARGGSYMVGEHGPEMFTPSAGGMITRNENLNDAVGGSVARGSSYMVDENGPEMFTPSASGSITRNENLGGGIGGTTVHIHVAGSVIHEKDLAVTVRDNIAQLMRRRGLNPAILGV